jgi:hypothetical protein
LVKVTFPEKLALFILAEPVEVISPVVIVSENISPIVAVVAVRVSMIAVVMFATLVVTVSNTALAASIIPVTIEPNVPVPVVTVLEKVPVPITVVSPFTRVCQFVIPVPLVVRVPLIVRFQLFVIFPMVVTFPVWVVFPTIFISPFWFVVPLRVVVPCTLIPELKVAEPFVVVLALFVTSPLLVTAPLVVRACVVMLPSVRFWPESADTILAVAPVLLARLYEIAASRFCVDSTPLTELVRWEPLVVSVLLVTITPVPILPPTLDVITFPEDESVLTVLRVGILAVPESVRLPDIDWLHAIRESPQTFWLPERFWFGLFDGVYPPIFTNAVPFGVTSGAETNQVDGDCATGKSGAELDWLVFPFVVTFDDVVFDGFGGNIQDPSLLSSPDRDNIQDPSLIWNCHEFTIFCASSFEVDEVLDTLVPIHESSIWELVCI